jgi:hypothetical protein
MPDVNAYNISEFNFPGSSGTRLYGISDRGEIIGDFLVGEYTDQEFTVAIRDNSLSLVAPSPHNARQRRFILGRIPSSMMCSTYRLVCHTRML